MNTTEYEEFTVELDNGQPVKVRWYKDYFHFADHIELFGPMTETGYRSDFLNKNEGEEFDPEGVKEHARTLAQKCWEENPNKYGRQATLL
jgi:hypothetical protein